MLSIPSIVENWRSNGVATEEAMVSGLAPERLAFTTIVGKSTFGRSFIGRSLYPAKPASRTPIITRVVITGRRMKGPEIFMDTFPV
jgi:hypothetical protein